VPTDRLVLSRDLIYDVGLHRGEDTAMYLAQGYRVTAFEANAELCTFCRGRFAAEIASGRLTIVEGAVTGDAATTVTFYKHSLYSIWGTIDPRWVDRNRAQGESEPVVVAAVDFSSWLKKTGVPLYMKVDIEGADRFCFEALRAFDDRPAYVSLESATTRMSPIEAEFDLLEELGYDRFAVVQQGDIEGSRRTVTTVGGERIVHRMEPGASGPFGPDLERWESRDRALRRYVTILALYRLFGDARIYQYRICRHVRWRLGRLLRRPLPGWYDTHGRHRSAP
jgi:FkbM family methyltransferase